MLRWDCVDETINSGTFAADEGLSTTMVHPGQFPHPVRAPTRRVWARFATALVVSTLVAGLAYTRPAAACSCMQSTEVYVFLPANKQLPANATGIWWHGMHNNPLTPGRVTLETLGPGNRWYPRNFRVVDGGNGIVGIVPTRENGQVWGETRHRLEIHAYSWSKPAKPQPVVVSEEFTVGSAALTSGSMGLKIGTPKVVETVGPMGASCQTKFSEVNLKVEPVLSPELEPFRDLLLFETLVDGESWQAYSHNCDQFPEGRNWLSEHERPGVDIVYSQCPVPEPEGSKFSRYVARDRGLKPGEHEVVIVATTPDQKFRVESDRIRVHLSCDGSPAIAAPPSEHDEPTTTTEQPNPQPKPAKAGPPEVGQMSGHCSVRGTPSPGTLGVLGLLVLGLRRRNQLYKQP